MFESEAFRHILAYPIPCGTTFSDSIIPEVNKINILIRVVINADF